MGIDTEDFGFVLYDIDVCFCDVEMEFEVWQQSGRGFILAVVCDPSEAIPLPAGQVEFIVEGGFPRRRYPTQVFLKSIPEELMTEFVLLE